MFDLVGRISVQSRADARHANIVVKYVKEVVDAATKGL